MISASDVTSYNFDKKTGWRIDLPEYIKPGTRVLCLYRVSTAKQLYRTADDEADIPMQRLRCRDFAERMGWTIVCELQEEGISGHKVRAENRDKIQLIKDYALKAKFDILLVFMFDRIGRISDETPFVVEWLVRQNIRVWSSEEGEQKIESHTDKLLNYIRFWQADGESQKTSIRTANSLHILAEQGFFTGRHCPYGYMLVKSGRINKRKQEVHDIVVCEHEAVVVELIFNLAYYHGKGAQSIANHLNERGYKNRNGDNWHPSTIRYILRNPIYVGQMSCGTAEVPVNESLRIIENKIFDGVQELLDIRSRRYQQTRSAPLFVSGHSLLSGNIFCGHCGARLCVTTCGKGRKNVLGEDVPKTRYCCQTKTRKHGDCDGQTGYTVEKLDKIIDAFAREVFSKVRNAARKDVVQSRYKSELTAQRNKLSSLRREHKKCENELEKLQDEIVNALSGESVFTPEMLKAAMDKQECKKMVLSAEIKQTEEELDKAEEKIYEIADKFSDLRTWADLYDKADIHQKKMLISRIVDRVDVYRDYDLKITMHISVEQFLNSIELVDKAV